jgi:hypothetical protein
MVSSSNHTMLFIEIFSLVREDQTMICSLCLTRFLSMHGWKERTKPWLHGKRWRDKEPPFHLDFFFDSFTFSLWLCVAGQSSHQCWFRCAIDVACHNHQLPILPCWPDASPPLYGVNFGIGSKLQISPALSSPGNQKKNNCTVLISGR